MLEVGSWRLPFTELASLLALLEPHESGATEAFEAIARFQTLGSLSRALGATESSVQSLREALLGEDGCLLLYLPGLEDTHVFAVDRAQVLDTVSGSHEE